MLKTKIVCTLGPSSSSRQVIEQLIESGMNVARLNCSHGNHAEKIEKIEITRSVSKNVAILLDSKGPEIRISEMEPDSFLRQSSEFILTTKNTKGNSNIASIDYKKLPSEVKKNDRIFLNDGFISLQVKSITKNDIRCIVLNGGSLTSRKSVNVPGHDLDLPFLSKGDIDDIKFAVNHNLDFIALSFVRNKQDVLRVKKLLNNSSIKIISKIEHARAVENFDEILEVSDGIMVARGDMGVELPFERVTLVQKDIIKKCNLIGKPVITATHMLQSMVNNPMPTRAEITDVGNAVIDGTDAVMLSGETANGKYPIKSVKAMAKIAAQVEDSCYNQTHVCIDCGVSDVADAISKFSYIGSNELPVAGIIALTASGFTARSISKFRPHIPIYAFTYNDHVLGQLALSYGVFPYSVDHSHNRDWVIYHSVEQLVSSKKLTEDDLIIILAGVPMGGTTNLLEIQKVKDIMKYKKNL